MKFFLHIMVIGTFEPVCYNFCTVLAVVFECHLNFLFNHYFCNFFAGWAA